ncbi:MAG: DUF177 domain-containing protein [Candidatus Eremiobacteraeota bacterium]|nr:DUF177 domain-containing protein [Candidatus Eremiobacteraeota bacterium]
MSRSHKIDISGLIAGSRQVMVVDDEVPIESFEGIQFPVPAKVHLEMHNVDRLLHVEGEVDATTRGECDLCLEVLEREFHVAIDERLDPSIGRDEEPFGENNVLVGGRLDIADLAQQLVLVQLPMGFRCSDDCKGLCAVCGTNRNAGTCACAAKHQATPPDGGRTRISDLLGEVRWQI